jgi:hypothetical protein
MARRLAARYVSSRDLEGGNLLLESLLLGRGAAVQVLGSSSSGEGRRPLSGARALLLVDGVLVPTQHTVAGLGDIAIVQTHGKKASAVILRRTLAPPPSARTFVHDAAGALSEVGARRVAMETLGGAPGPWRGLAAAVPRGSSSAVFVL